MRAVRRTIATLIATALAGATASVGAGTPAQADDTIRTQWYVASSGLSALKAKGLDGSGVTIAVIDVAAPDMSVPELRGADVTVVKPCTDTPTASDVSHTTAVASVLASPDFGWAPKAKYIFYVHPNKFPAQYQDRTCLNNGTHEWGWAVNDAINRGADLISIQILASSTGGLEYALVRAAIRGVPVICGLGNENRSEKQVIGSSNLVVGVGAVDKKNKRATFSDWGPGLSIMAPGTDFTVRDPDGAGKLTRMAKAQGTSFSAPMVSGAMALAKQAWPKANGNQLVRSLLYTATRPVDQYNQKTGWGTLNATKFTSFDPTGLPTDSPLKEKNPKEIPTPQDWADYTEGMVLPDDIHANDQDYVYRGDVVLACESAPRCELGTSPRLATASPKPSSNAASPAGSPPVVPLVIGGIGVVVLLGVVVGVVVVLTRRRKVSDPTSVPPTPGSEGTPPPLG
ncbi:MAG: S8 family serine peptidase [Propionicimonas sp.]